MSLQPVFGDTRRIRRALLSVSDKTGLVDLAQALAAQGVQLAEPTWYHGAAYGAFWLHAGGFGH